MVEELIASPYVVRPGVVGRYVVGHADGRDRPQRRTVPAIERLRQAGNA